MRVHLWAYVVLAAIPTFAAAQMNVSVCTRGNLSKKVAVGAEEAASSVFRFAGVEIVWPKCEIALEGDAAMQQHWFTLRLRAGSPLIKMDPDSFDALGQTYLSFDDTGYIADVYYEAVQTLASSKQLDFTSLLGYVMAHELGHLLLGPGHAAMGVMRAKWDPRDLRAMDRHWLEFSREEVLRMRQILSVPFAGTPAS
jgi:hypothetical protein